MLGALLYCQAIMAQCALAISQHARVQSNPGHAHWLKLTETGAHMTSDRRRKLEYSGKSYSMDTDLETVDTFPATHLVAYSDSSHADLKSLCPCEDCSQEHGMPWEANDSKRTTIGHVAMYAGSLVDHFTTTCPRTYHSTESELVASAAASKRLLAIKRLLQHTPMHTGSKLNGNDLVPLYMDNQSCIKMCLNKHYTKRGAHIDLKYFKARELHNTELCIRKVLTTYNASDPQTKALPREEFTRHANTWSTAPARTCPPRGVNPTGQLYTPHSPQYSVDALL